MAPLILGNSHIIQADSTRTKVLMTASYAHCMAGMPNNTWVIVEYTEFSLNLTLKGYRGIYRA